MACCREFSLDHFDDYEKHFTVMNYKDNVEMNEVRYCISIANITEMNKVRQCISNTNIQDINEV